MHVVEIVCGGLEGGDGGGFGYASQRFVLHDAFGGGWRFVLHDFHDEVGDNAGAFCLRAELGAWGEGA